MRPISDTYTSPLGSTTRPSTTISNNRFRPPPTVTYINEEQATRFIDQEDEQDAPAAIAKDGDGYLMPSTTSSTAPLKQKRLAPLAPNEFEPSVKPKTNVNTVGYVAPELPKLSKLSLPHSHTETDV